MVVNMVRFLSLPFPFEPAIAVTRPSIWKTMVSMFVLLTTAVSAAQFGIFTYTEQSYSVYITACSQSASGAVVIPATIVGKPVEIIGSGAFQDCDDITSVTIPSGVTTIQPSAFAYCDSLTSVTLPSGLRTIGANAFAYCRKLNGMAIPVGVISIGSNAFVDCALTNLTIPASTTGIGNQAFWLCGELTSITVDPANPAYASESGVLFNKAKTTLIKCSSKKPGAYSIPTSVTQIEYAAFEQCTELTGVTIPTSVTSIGESAFAFCSSLKTVVIPSSITIIPQRAFSYCYGLESVTIPSTVTSIGGSAFFNCDALSNVSISANVSVIGQSAFAACESLVSIQVSANNPYYTSVQGVLFDKSMGTLIQCPAGVEGSYAIPYGTVTIGNFAFDYCGITSVTIPSTVTSIETGGFSGCRDLPAVTLPASLTSLGHRVFSYCFALTQATFMGDAPTMGTDVFDGKGAGFTVYCYNNRTGFTFPTWLGLTTVNLGDHIDLPQDLKIEETPGVELTSGGMVSGLGATAIGSSTSVSLTLTNTGTADLTDLAVSTSGSHAGDFQVTVLESDYLAGGTSQTFQISFAPKGAGTRTATLQISSSDEDESPFELVLQGTGTAPEIDIEQPAGSAVAYGGSRNFGSITVGGARKLTFTIKNSGNGDLSGLTPSLLGTHAADYAVSLAPAEMVSAGGRTTFAVELTPSGGGTRSAILRISSNDPDENPYDIILIGKGVVIPEISIEQPVGSGLVDGASKRSFGTVKVGKAGKSKIFTLKNTGTAKLTGLSINRTGKHQKDFVVSALSKTSLAPGATTTFKIAFKPSAKGTRSAAIHIKSNDADESPFDIKLSGMGAAK